MANGIQAAFDGEATRLSYPEMPWEAEQLIFIVREPFISKTSAAGIVCGIITPETPLELESHMPGGGVIFSDGVEADNLAFNAGARATIRVAERKTRLVIE